VHGEIMAGPGWMIYDAPIHTGMQHSGKAHGNAFGVALAAGATLPGGLVLGGTLLVHVQNQPSFDNSDVTRGWDDWGNSVAGPGVFSRWYPSPRDGFHLEALAALVQHRTKHEVHIDGPVSCPPFLPDCFDRHTQTLELSETSWGYELGAGVGYELWIARQFSLGLTARMQYAHTWDGSRRYTFLLPALGLGLTYH